VITEQEEQICYDHVYVGKNGKKGGNFRHLTTNKYTNVTHIA